jgi:erythrocyte band 7 integral membrane protein
MNLGTMGAAGMDNVAQQIAASSRHDDEHGGPSSATNAGIISSMANV